MKHYVFDSFAMIAFFEKEKSAPDHRRS